MAKSKPPHWKLMPISNRKPLLFFSNKHWPGRVFAWGYTRKHMSLRIHLNPLEEFWNGFLFLPAGTYGFQRILHNCGIQHGCFAKIQTCNIADLICVFLRSGKVTLSLPHSTCFGWSIVSQDVSKKGHKLIPSRKLTAKTPENQWFEDGHFSLRGFKRLFSGAWKLLVSGVVYLQQKSQPDAGSGRRIASQPSGHVIAMSRRTRYRWDGTSPWIELPP